MHALEGFQHIMVEGGNKIVIQAVEGSVNSSCANS